MNADELKDVVVAALEDLKGVDIKTLDVRGKTSITDVLVIAAGTSTRQVKALADHVVERVKEAGLQPLSVEGERESNWVLVDLGDVVVHVMLPETRDFYNLEKLWGDAPTEASLTGDNSR
ncbi:MAG: ribosome silencing factor [Gammaproteobacteria bacterium]|nr:ribosome silencing factor [Gammaproteobacteria bacterium]